MGDKVVCKTGPSYLYLKGTTYYFTRHVPLDIREHYRVGRVRVCLKTQSYHATVSAAKAISQKLDDYWLALRLSTAASSASLTSLTSGISTFPPIPSSHRNVINPKL